MEKDSNFALLDCVMMTNHCIVRLCAKEDNLRIVRHAGKLAGKSFAEHAGAHIDDMIRPKIHRSGAAYTFEKLAIHKQAVKQSPSSSKIFISV